MTDILERGFRDTEPAPEEYFSIITLEELVLRQRAAKIVSDSGNGSINIRVVATAGQNYTPTPSMARYRGRSHIRPYTGESWQKEMCTMHSLLARLKH